MVQRNSMFTEKNPKTPACSYPELAYFCIWIKSSEVQVKECAIDKKQWSPVRCYLIGCMTENQVKFHADRTATWSHTQLEKKLLVSLKVFQRSSMKKLCVAVPSPSECRECLIDRNTHNLAHDVDAFHICSAYATSKHTIGENGHTQANITNFSVSSKAFEFDDKPNVGLMKHEFHTINCIACVRQHTTFVP